MIRHGAGLIRRHRLHPFLEELLVPRPHFLNALLALPPAARGELDVDLPPVQAGSVTFQALLQGIFMREFKESAALRFRDGFLLWCE